MNDPLLNQFLERITTAIPDIQIHSARIMSSGVINDVLLVNDALVFRFPRKPEDVERLEYEYQLLTTLWGALPLPIPNPIYHHPDPSEEPFMEYVHLSGEPLSGFKDQAQPHAKRIAVQLADFVLALHKAPLDGLELPIQNVGRKETLPQLHEAIQAVLSPHLSEEAQHRIAQQCGDYCNWPDIDPDRLVIRHGDLGPNNILIDPDTFDITGIIDFGSAGLDEPASDLGHIAFWGALEFGEEFVETFLNRYGVDAALWQQAQFYSMLIACIIAMGDLEGQNSKALHSALRYLNQTS